MSRDEIHPAAAEAPGYLTNHAARVFNRRVDAALRPYGVTLAQSGPLLLLSWKGPMLQRDLVRHSSVRQPAMVALLRKLESAGLVQRRGADRDRRAAVVSLTERGASIAAIAGQVLEDANDAGRVGMSASEARLLTALLQRFISTLEAEQGTLHHE